MARLTMRDPDKFVNSEGVFIKIDCDIEAVHKLAAYEDSGLTPERVAELAEAERDGRLFGVPLRIGGKVYTLERVSMPDDVVIRERVVTGFLVSKYGINFHLELTEKIFGGAAIFPPTTDTDAGVYRTRAEAEAALGRKGKE